MNIQERSAELANRIITKPDEDILANKDKAKEILAEINTLISEVKNNKSEMLEEILTCQVYLLNLLFKNQIQQHLATGENEIKTALTVQRQALTTIRALKQLKTPSKLKRPPMLTKRQLIQRLGENMSHNTYTALINTQEYIEAAE